MYKEKPKLRSKLHDANPKQHYDQPTRHILLFNKIFFPILLLLPTTVGKKFSQPHTRIENSIILCGSGYSANGYDASTTSQHNIVT